MVAAKAAGWLGSGAFPLFIPNPNPGKSVEDSS
jgi:hypothetical protein